jgi:hypothetical protein
MLVAPQSYRGIDFVREADLPPAQQLLLRQSANPPERIKILINGKVVEGCIYYKDYQQWFERVYRTAKQQGIAVSKPNPELLTEVVIRG